MKTLLSTTALVFALGFPTLVLAQSAQPAADQAATANMGITGFLAERGQSDVFASDLMGHAVHARRTPTETMTDGKATMNENGMAEMMMMNTAELDNMDEIGEINEIVLSADGQVRALVIGVGGFLGVGEQDIAVTMDQVTFASDPDDRSEMFIVVNTGADLLREAPAYQRTLAINEAATDVKADAEKADAEVAAEATADADKAEAEVAAETKPIADSAVEAKAVDATADAETRANRTAFAAPDIDREGYARVEVTEVSTEMLMGKTVYDVNDNDLGSVTDMIIDDAGSITNVIIDFGGFLGIGSSQASISFEELTILSTEGYEEVRLYVDASKDQIQELPQYEAAK